MTDDEQVIAHTHKWIVDVVVGCNFCPFAAKELKKNAVRYQVERSGDTQTVLESFIKECIVLDENDSISTTLLILPGQFENFEDYLDLVAMAEELLEDEDYEGIYQVASFHPQYLFGGAPADDPANYTNRSPYPMLHLLREDAVEEALEKFPHPERIPENNISYARAKGLEQMEKLRAACMGIQL